MRDFNKPNSWAYRWLYTLAKNNALSILPINNLIDYAGTGPDATHTVKSRPLRPAQIVIKQPLSHPPYVSRDITSDRTTFLTVYKGWRYTFYILPFYFLYVYFLRMLRLFSRPIRFLS